MKKCFTALILILCVSFCFVSCRKVAEKPAVKSKNFYTYFDTVISVYSYSDETDSQFEMHCNEIEKIYDRYNRLFDVYHQYSDYVNLYDVNANAGEWVNVDDEVIELLDYAETCYQFTGGEVNVMLGPVIKLWKEKVPADSELAEAASHCSINNLEIDKYGHRVRISDANSSIDVGAIAKGWATEKVAEYLNKNGVSGYIINAGGNVRLIGEKPGEVDWKIAIRNPDENAADYAEVLKLHDISCVTSGSYERFTEIDGKRYCHIIDVDTMKPADRFSSVSVVAQDSAYADALSTALFCMGLEEGMDFAKQHGDFEAMWITPDGSEFFTAGMGKYR